MMRYVVILALIVTVCSLAQVTTASINWNSISINISILLVGISMTLEGQVIGGDVNFAYINSLGIAPGRCGLIISL